MVSPLDNPLLTNLLSDTDCPPRLTLILLKEGRSLQIFSALDTPFRGVTAVSPGEGRIRTQARGRFVSKGDA